MSRDGTGDNPRRSNQITRVPGRTVPGDDLLGDDPKPNAKLIHRLILVVVAGRIAQVTTTDGATPLQPFTAIRRLVPKDLDRSGDQDAPQLIPVLGDRYTSTLTC